MHGQHADSHTEAMDAEPQGRPEGKQQLRVEAAQADSAEMQQDNPEVEVQEESPESPEEQERSLQDTDVEMQGSSPENSEADEHQDQTLALIGTELPEPKPGRENKDLVRQYSMFKQPYCKCKLSPFCKCCN